MEQGACTVQAALPQGSALRTSAVAVTTTPHGGPRNTVSGDAPAQCSGGRPRARGGEQGAPGGTAGLRASRAAPRAGVITEMLIGCPGTGNKADQGPGVPLLLQPITTCTNISKAHHYPEADTGLNSDRRAQLLGKHRVTAEGAKTKAHLGGKASPQLPALHSSLPAPCTGPHGHHEGGRSRATGPASGPENPWRSGPRWIQSGHRAFLPCPLPP